MNSTKLALEIKKAIEEKQGIDPIILDIRKLTYIADYFVIVSGNSDRHVRTLADAVRDQLRDESTKPRHSEGMRDGKWILLDYGSVICHIFHKDTRAFYNLERLWGEAKILDGKSHERRSKKTRTKRT